MSELHCFNEDNCSIGGCALQKLERTAPGIAKHISVMTGRFGLGAVTTALRQQEANFDAMDFESMRGLAGRGLLTNYEDGESTEREALQRIAECHGI